MKMILVIFCFAILCGFSRSASPAPAHSNMFFITDTIPAGLPATFVDDYNIKYTISDSLWWQQPSAKYHILRWNKEKEYLIAKNDANNPSEKGLYTRIDYMKFSGMGAFTWGFCLTTYNAASDSLAEFGPIKIDRANPKKGCNGFPFSRMKIAQ